MCCADKRKCIKPTVPIEDDVTQRKSDEWAFLFWFVCSRARLNPMLYLEWQRLNDLSMLFALNDE